MLCVLHRLMENNRGKAIQWGSGGWKAEACTPPGVLLRYFWGLCSMSRLICIIFVADLIAFRLKCFMEAVACKLVTTRLRFFVWLL